MELSNIMNTFYKLLQISLSGSFAVLYLLALRIVLKKLPKSVTYVLWLLVVFHLVCTVAPVSKFAIIPKVNIAWQLGYMEVNWKVFAIIYLAGLFGVLLVNVVGYFWVSYNLKRNAYLVNSAYEETDRIKWMNVQIYHCQAISSAFAMGYFQPRIYLPEGLDEETEKMILLHERTHINRGDCLVKLIAFLLCAINWYNPLVWCAFYFFVRDQEASCDEIVLQKIGTEQKKQYADTILRAASGFYVSGEKEHALAFGEANIKYRIRHCLNTDYATNKVYFFTIIITMIFMVWGIFVSEKFSISSVPFQTSKEITDESIGVIDKKSGIVYEMRGNGIYRIDSDGETLIYKENYSEIPDFFIIEGDLFFISQEGIKIKHLDVADNTTEDIVICENGRRINSFYISDGIINVKFDDNTAESRKLSIKERKTATAKEILENPGTVYNVTQWTDDKAKACLDINQDGINENVCLDFSLDEMNEKKQTDFSLTIENDNIQSSAKSVANEIFAVSFDGKNLYLALKYRVVLTDGMENVFTSFYQYNNKAINFCFEIEADIEKIEISGNTIIASIPQDIVLGEDVHIVWDIDAQGRAIKQEGDYSQITEVSYYLHKELTVHEEPGSYNTYVIQPQMVRICRITKERQWQVDNKEYSGFWVELICEDGMTGWIFVSDKILPETKDSVYDLFTIELNVYYYSMQ